MRREHNGRIRDRLADRLEKFRPVKQLKERVASQALKVFVVAVLAIGIVAGLVAAFVGGN